MTCDAPFFLLCADVVPVPEWSQREMIVYWLETTFIHFAVPFQLGSMQTNGYQRLGKPVAVMFVAYIALQIVQTAYNSDMLIVWLDSAFDIAVAYGGYKVGRSVVYTEEDRQRARDLYNRLPWRR